MLIYSRYTWWVAAMVGLALLLAVAGQTGLLNPFQGLFLTATEPVDNAVSSVAEPVAEFLSGGGGSGNLKDQNDRLRIENEQLRNQVVQLEQDTQRLKELEAALNIVQANSGEPPLPANIVHRDNSPFTAVVSIDRGSSNGVKVGMVVLSSQGTLMGSVTKVFDDQSFVRLITDSRSRVTARTVNSQADGIIAGSPERGLIFDRSQADINVGDAVVTSGLGGNYPQGIPIGTVTSVEGTPQDLFKKVTVEPGTRLSTAQTVLVLKSFLPASIGVEDGE